MASEWPFLEVIDIAERAASGPFGSNIKGIDYVEKGVPVIRGLNLAGPKFYDAEYVFVTEEKAESLSSSLAYPGDIVFAARGSVGAVGIVPDTHERYLLSSNLVKLTADEHKADPTFIFYFFRSCFGQNEINSYVNTTGVPKIARALESLRKFRVPMPPLGEQRAIAHILGTLDDKIELNRRMNETLEAIARAIFKSWFIDFDPVIDNALRAGNPIPSAFSEKVARRRELLSRAKAEGRDSCFPKHIADLFPDSFEDCELGEIPHGWDIKAIGDVAERVAMGPFGSSLKVETFVPDGVPIISGQHLRGFMLEDNTFNFITYEHAERLGNAIVQRGDVVFTHAGNIGQAAFIPNTSRYEHYVISQRQFYLRCDLSRISPTYIALFFSSHRGRNLLLANTSSSGVPSIARPVTYLRSIRLLIPKKVVLDEFERLLKPLLLLYRQNKETNLTLAALRDMLLPKLVSGELRVKDSENYVRGSV